MPRVVGIDLGTTNSVIATIIGGEPTKAEGTSGCKLLAAAFHEGDKVAVDVQAGQLGLRKGEPAPM
jgi:molecular chaperone DnaK (HSP70)